MLHSGRQECFVFFFLFFFLPWIKDSFSEDFDFDLSGQLSRSTQEHFNLTSTVTLPLRSTWFGPRRLLFAFRWRRPDSSFCCLMIPLPLWQLRWDLNSQDIWRRYLNPQFGPKVQSMTRAQSFLSSGDVQKSVLKEWVQRFPWWKNGTMGYTWYCGKLNLIINLWATN